MRFCVLAALLPVLLLSSCNSGGQSGSTAMSAASLKKAYSTKKENPFQLRRKSWLRDKTDRLGLTKDKPNTLPVTGDVFRSNQ